MPNTNDEAVSECAYCNAPELFRVRTGCDCASVTWTPACGRHLTRAVQDASKLHTHGNAPVHVREWKGR